MSALKIKWFFPMSSKIYNIGLFIPMFVVIVVSMDFMEINDDF